MDSNSGIAAIKAAAAKKRNASGAVASKLGGFKPGGNKGSSGVNPAIARRLNKSNSNPANDHDEDDLS